MAKHPSFDPEPILAQASWIRKVVRQMLRDEHLAEDLAQQALEVGLRNKSRIQGSTRSWLYGVAQNLHLQFLRGQQRREKREQRVAVSESTTQSQDLVEKMEVMQMVEQAVLALPQEPRDLLILRYYEDHSVRQLAEMQGVPIKTMDSRLQRAKQLLRAQLQTRIGSNWIAVLLPLTAGAPASSLALSPISIFLMSKFFKVAAVLLIAVLGSTMFWPDETLSDGHADPGEGLEANADVQAKGFTPGDGVASEFAIAELAPSAADRTAITSGLRLRVTDESGEAIEGAEVLAFHASSFYLNRLYTDSLPNEADKPKPTSAPAKSDEGGVVHLADLEVDFHGVLYIRAEHFSWRGFEIIPDPLVQGAERDLGDKILERGGHQAFRFVDPGGTPLEDLRVSFYARPFVVSDSRLRIQVQFTDQDGIVDFASLPLEAGRWTCNAVGFEAWSLEIAQPDLTRQAPTEVSLSRGGSITVKVVDTQGRPVPQAAIFYQNSRFTISSQFLDDSWWTGFQGHTDENGEYIVSGISEDVKASIRAIHEYSWNDADGQKAGSSVTIKLPVTHKVTGRFVFSDGGSAQGAKITLIHVDLPHQNSDYSADLDEEGGFTTYLPTGDYGIEVTHQQGSWQPKDPLIVEASLDLGEVLIPKGPELRLDFVDAETSTPIEGVIVKFPHAAGGRRYPKANLWKKVLASLRSNFDGFQEVASQVICTHLFPGVHTLEIEAPGYSKVTQTVELFEGRATHQTIVLHASAELELRVVDSTGQPVAGARMELVPESFFELLRQRKPGEAYPRPPSQNMFGNVTDDEGLVTIEKLSPGLWHIGVDPHARAGFPFSQIEIKRGENQQTVVYPQPVEVTVDITANGVPIPGAKLNLLRLDPNPSKQFSGIRHSETTTHDGPTQLKPVQAGLYRIKVSAEGYLPIQEDVDIQGSMHRLAYDLAGPVVSGRVNGGTADAEVILYQFFGEQEDLEENHKWLLKNFELGRGSNMSVYTRKGRFSHQKVNTNGEFALHCLEPGTYSIFARSTDRIACQPIQIDVPESGINGLEFVLKPSATVILQVTGMREFLKTYPGAYFIPEVVNGNVSVRSDFFIMEDGEYTFRQVPVANVYLEMDFLFTNPETSQLSVGQGPKLSVQATAGEIIRLDWDASRVVDRGTAGR
jgi:RNA polymerase sigma factor (sigma-70 family)